MNDPGSFSAGEAGGIFAGVTMLLGLLGGGIKWLLGWKDRRDERLAAADEKRSETRATKLQAWHDELAAREKRLDDEQAAWQAKLEQRITVVERENRGLRIAIQLLAPALRRLDPASPELARAEKILDAAFAIDPDIPSAMDAHLGALD